MVPQIVHVCQLCDQNNTAIYICVDCNGDLCQKCYEIHYGAFTNHLFKKLEEPRGLCLKHFQEIELFDPTSNTPLCINCERKGEVWDWNTLNYYFQQLVSNSKQKFQVLNQKINDIARNQNLLIEEQKQMEVQIQIKTEEKIKQVKEEEKIALEKNKKNYEEKMQKLQKEENRIKQKQKDLQNAQILMSDKLVDITDKYITLKEFFKEEVSENEAFLPIVNDVLKDFQELSYEKNQEFPPLVSAKSEKSDNQIKIVKKVHSQASSQEQQEHTLTQKTVWPKFNLEEYMQSLAAEDFYMYRFKTAPCPYTSHHNITTCIYGHGTLIRRPPDIFKYQPIKCEHMTNEGGEGCPLNIHCPFTHCKLEYLFHPDFYKSTQCKNKDHDNKTDKSCAFYHTPKEQRHGENPIFCDPFLKNTISKS